MITSNIIRNLEKIYKVRSILFLFVILLSINFVACGVAVMLLPDASQWKERVYSVKMDNEEIFKIASQALASLGKIDNSNKDALQVGGECGEEENNVVITIKKGEDKSIVSIKSRLLTKVRGGKYTEIGSDKRGDCIQKVYSEMKNLGCELTEIESSK